MKIEMTPEQEAEARKLDEEWNEILNDYHSTINDNLKKAKMEKENFLNESGEEFTSEVGTYLNPAPAKDYIPLRIVQLVKSIQRELNEIREIAKILAE